MNAATIAAGRPDEERALEARFERVRVERMADVPIVNARLRVEALGFRDWHGVRVGALVTPWSVNLVILPAPGRALPPARRGEPCTWTCPSGTYAFDAHDDPVLGSFQQCSLFSPVLEFACHEDAATAARAALEALFATPQPARLTRRGLLLGD